MPGAHSSYPGNKMVANSRVTLESEHTDLNRLVVKGEGKVRSFMLGPKQLGKPFL